MIPRHYCIVDSRSKYLSNTTITANVCVFCELWVAPNNYCVGRINSNVKAYELSLTFSKPKRNSAAGQVDRALA